MAAVQLEELIPDAEERRRLKQATVRRVSWLVPAGGGVVSGGRAAAISADGYFLTANHVVDGPG